MASPRATNPARKRPGPWRGVDRIGRTGLAGVVLLAPAAAVAEMDIVFINRCAATCFIEVGVDDAINRKSEALVVDTTFFGFPFSDAVFDATVTCIRSLLAPYDIRVITADPGPVPRREVILDGHAASQGLPPGVQGLAPWYDGAPRDNVLAFAFAAQLGPDPDLLCWVAARQIGTLYGLDAALHCPDVMSHIPDCGLKTFTDFNAPCGEFALRACDTAPPRPRQNSAAILAANAGQADVVFRDGFELAGPSP
jgi:hypothetical protein